jgi:hypothetical protein
MNIFEQLDVLLNSAKKLNESFSYEDLPIEPTMATAEQAEEYIREYFKNVLDAKEEEKKKSEDGPKPPMGPMPVTPPPPPFSREKKTMSDDGGDADRSWSDKDLEWEDDDFLKRLEIEADELEKGEDGEEGEDYDDFTDKSPKGGAGGGGEGDDDDENDDYSEESSSGGSSKKKSSETEKEKKDTDDDDSSTGETMSEEEGDGDDMRDGGDSEKGSKKSDKKGKGEKSEEGTEEGDDMEGLGEGEGKEGEGEEKEGEGKEGEGSGSGEKKEGEGKEGDSEDGEGKGGGSSSDEELKETIEDALKELSERNESEREELKELLDMLEDEKTDTDDIEGKEKEFDDAKENGKEKLDKLKSLVGKVEKTPSKEEIDKEIEASKLSEDEIKDLKSKTTEAAEEVTPPTDEELEGLKKEAMKELDKKCKGHSKLATSILYHSLKTPKIDKGDWDKIIEKVLKKKSKHMSNDDKSKSRKVILGDKNHIWRDVRYGYKTVKGGADKQSIYCFIDYSGSVKSRPGLIVSFLGKVLELTERLKYTDLQLYTFADKLSVPRIISEEMLKKDGYETVLGDTISFFDLPENDVGGSIEDFSLVGYEINKIKKNDKDAVIFIFGDGVWTFYGNWNPPTKLKETCPRWIKDIIAFVFYDDKRMLEYLGKEISLLKDVVGIEDVIVTQTSEMKE